MITNSFPIGIFDSGSGGLTVLKVLQEQLPHEHFVYLADTYNLPYGTKSPEQILCHTRQALDWLQHTAQVKMIIVACHTSSALALDALKADYTIPIIGMIYPLLEHIIGNENYKKIGIIATPASAYSKVHENLFIKNGFTGTISSISCPDFVPLIEAEYYDIHAIHNAALQYLAPFKTDVLDTLLYGCTHYPLIEDIIKPLLPSTTHYIDPAYAITNAVEKILSSNGIDNKQLLSHKIEVTYYCTNNPNLFTLKINKIIGTLSPTVELVKLNQLQ